jgi:Tfp pilus assembly protein PilN
MAVNLNLLPQDLAVGSSLNRIIRIIRAINVISIVAFIIFAVGVGAFYAVSSVRLNSLTSENKASISQIKERQTTEQRLILLKDRIAKIKLAYSSDSIAKSIDLVSPLLSQLPEDASVTEMNLDANKITISILFKSSSEISNFLEKIYSSKDLTGVTLTSFGFNPTTGYLVSMNLIGK